MVVAWTFTAIAALSIILASSYAQRALFFQQRQVEIRDETIRRLDNQIELLDRKLEAEEILLKRVRDFATLGQVQR